MGVEPNAFVLELPLRKSELEAAAGAAGRVLVVDDDEPLARMMAEFLSEHGFSANWAGSCRAVRRALVKPAAAL